MMRKRLSIGLLVLACAVFILCPAVEAGRGYGGHGGSQGRPYYMKNNGGHYGGGYNRGGYYRVGGHGGRHYGGGGYYLGAWTLGFGLGMATQYLLTPPPPVVYSPAPVVVYQSAAPPPSSRQVRVCEPAHYVDRKVYDRETGRYFWTRDLSPERCWYEVR